MNRTGYFLALAAGTSLCSSSAFAQAWVPTEHSLSVSFEYAFVFSSSDVFSSDFAVPDLENPGGTTRFQKNANLRTHLFIPTIDYTPIANLGLRVALPMALSGCAEPMTAPSGSCPHNHPPNATNVDDGEMRFTLQDLNTELRYMIDFTDIITIAPLIGFSFPTNDYPTVGHAVVGRGRPQLRLGLNFGRALSEVIPGAYVHGRYQFSYVFPLKKDAYSGMENPALSEISIHRSSGDFEFGYFIFEDLSIRLTTHLELTHGGIQYGDPQYFGVADTEPGYVPGLNHDVLGKEEYLLVGLGATYILLEEVFLSATFLKWVAGKNTHDSDSINFAISYTVF